MTRQELFDLVWSQPVTRVAESLGVSDVAVKNHCRKHHIPTPSRGYWAKLKSGKKVSKPRLRTSLEPADALVNIQPRPVKTRSPAVTAIESQALSYREQIAADFRLVERLPRTLHPFVDALRTLLEETEKDQCGFRDLGDSYWKKTCLSDSSKARAFRLLQSMAALASKLGHELYLEKSNCFWKVGEEIFEFTLYETRDQKPHTPTKEELEYEARRLRWSGNSDRKSYRTWDYYPSGRLIFHISDNQSDWRLDLSKNERRWRDTKATTLEERALDIFVWLQAAAVEAKEKRLLIEEEERRQEKEAERQARIRQRKKNAKSLRNHINELGDVLSTIHRLEQMVEFIDRQDDSGHWATGPVSGCGQKSPPTKTF
ncbi:hypothetical protein [Haliea salexigens]|uniref:hypothetical protein n=1 Tax=Haliea salexigens TaxID=287487 RepID=UPI0003F96952|nr:hypothetical protein [Haliea salexigens]